MVQAAAVEVPFRLIPCLIHQFECLSNPQAPWTLRDIQFMIITSDFNSTDSVLELAARSAVLLHKLQMLQPLHQAPDGTTHWTLTPKIATITGSIFIGLRTEYFHKTGAEWAWPKTTLGTQLSSSFFTSLSSQEAPKTSLSWTTITSSCQVLITTSIPVMDGSVKSETMLTYLYRPLPHQPVSPLWLIPERLLRNW